MADHLTSNRFAEVLRHLGVSVFDRVAIAVSGGVDSIVLAHLAWQWGQTNGAQVSAYTVDHGLRDGSAAEALQVQQTLGGWGMPCRVLTWQNAETGPGLQHRARTARYRLLTEAATADGIAHVLLAHHADDQAETFWIRLADGSGLSGLTGMQAARLRDGILWLRPLLNATRQQIRDYAEAQALPVIEDPSNKNEQFLRVRLRGFAERLEAEGLTPQRLNRTMDKLAEADNALAEIADAVWQRSVYLHPAGAIRLDLAEWAQAPRELRRRLIQRALMMLSPSPYPPSYDQLSLLADTAGAPDFGGHALAGCLLRQKKGYLWIMREAAALPPVHTIARDASDSLVWDRRFVVRGLAALAGRGYSVGGLGEAGWQDISQRQPPALWPDDWSDAPMGLRAALMAVFLGEKPVAVPQLSWSDAEFDADMPVISPAYIV